MKHLYLLAAVAMVAACKKAEDTTVAANNVEVAATNDMAANTAAPAPAGPAMTLLGTSWEYTREGKALQESIDSTGNYITVSGAEHVDHGTYKLVDGKQCFTSAMTKDGQLCWTAPAKVDVGQSADITSDKGEKLSVKRVAYVVRKM